MARIRIASTPAASIPTPPAGKATMFVDTDLSFKAKLPDGSLIPISTTIEFIQDTFANFIQDSSTINFTYDDSGNIAYLEVIQSALDVFQIPITPTGNLASDNVGDALNELQDSIDATDATVAAHLNGGPSKHDATEIDYERADVAKTSIQAASDNVESALSDLDDNKLARSGVQPMTGDLNMDGNDIITGVGLVDGRDVSADGAKLDTIETGATADQIAAEVPYTPTGDLLTSTNVQDALDELEELISEEQIVVVSKTPGTGQFSSIKAAIDSILDASSTKPYLVRVGPGIYIEDTITLKPFIVVEGVDDGTSIIEVDDPSKTAIIGSNDAELRYLGIRGSTDANTDLIYFQGNSVNGGFSLIECALGSAYRLVHVEGDGFPTVFRMEGTRIFNNATFTEGFLVDRASTGFVLGFFSGLIYEKIGGTYPDTLFRVTGGARIVLDRVTVETDGSVTDGVVVDDGSHLDVITSAFAGMNIGVHAPNIGAAPSIQIEQLSLRDNVQDLLIEHPGTVGNFAGNADFTKVTIDPAADFSLFYNDTTAGGIAISGSVRVGRRHEILFDGLDLLQATPGMGIISGGFLTDNGGFDVGVGSGFGYLQANPYPDFQVRRIDWNNTSITLAANQDVYIFFNSSGILTSAASIGNTNTIILIGRVVTNATGIELIEQSPMLARTGLNFLNRSLREGFGPIYSTGSIVSENVTPFKLNITAGVYFYALNRFTPVGGSAISLTQYYRDGLGGYTKAVSDTVNNTQYDNGSGTLQNLTAGYFTAHTVYINCDDADEKYFLVFGQDEYSALGAVESSPLPTAPSWLKDAVTPIARIVIEQGTGNIAAIYDIRPVLGFKSSGVSASADHGNLIGLSDDDHPQYLLVNGTRAMADDLNMGGNDINNVGLVDGVDVSAHAARHLPNGADPLTTASAVTITDSTNGVGTANSFARSDHSHAHGNRGGGSLHANVTTSVAGFMSAADKTKLDGIEAGATADQLASEVPYNNATSGLTATNVQTAIDEVEGRLDTAETTLASHLDGGASKHDASEIDYERADGSKVSIQATSDNVESALTDLDDNKLARSGVQAMTGNLDMGGNAINNVGLVDGVDVSAHAARHLPAGADPLATAAPVGALGATSTNTEGTANSMARSDHTHDIATGVVSTLTPDQANAEGSSANLARADHIHNVPADVPVTANANGSNDEGVGTAFARNDHKHNIATAAPSTLNPDVANTEGVSPNLARADHIHNVPAASAVGLDATSANAEGVSTSFARADHTHDLATGAPSNQPAGTAVNAEGSSANLARADHVHVIPTAAAVGLNANSTNTEGNSTSFARANHTHDIDTGAASQQTPDQSNAEGSSPNLARADHTHNIPTATASGLNANSTNTQGVAASFARSDHTHDLETGTPVTQAPDQANAEGTSTSLARADHVHNIPAASAVGISTSTANAEGVSSSFARADHTHDVDITNSEASATADATTTSGTDVLMTGMTLTPAAGTYLVLFSGSVECSGDDEDIFVNIYVGGSIVAHTERQATDVSSLGSSAGTSFPIATQCLAVVNGSQAIEVRWRRTAGTATVHERTLTLLKVG